MSPTVGNRAALVRQSVIDGAESRMAPFHRALPFPGGERRAELRRWRRGSRRLQQIHFGTLLTVCLCVNLSGPFSNENRVGGYYFTATDNFFFIDIFFFIDTLRWGLDTFE